MSELQRKRPPPYRIKTLGLTMDRESLYAFIDQRVDQMMADGLLEEVRVLLEEGYSPRLPSMSALGYRQLAGHLLGEQSLSAAVERIKYETHRFVRQQYTWFRLDDARIEWFDVRDEGWIERIEAAVRAWLKGS